MEETKIFVVTLLSSGAVSAALSGLLLWLTKSWIGERLRNAIKSEYDQKLESYKQSLKSQADIALEQLKSSLAIEAHQRNTTLANLLQRRFEAIAAIVAPLRRLHRAVAGYTSVAGEIGGGARSAERKAVAQAQEELLTVLDEQAIFIDETSAAQVDSIRRQCEKAARLFLHFVDVAHDMPSGSDVEQWMEIVKVIEEDAPLAIHSLERDLRVLMGDAASNHRVATGGLQ